MKFSESWLKEWVNPNVSTDDLIEKLTMAGLEVDATEPAAGAFSGVVVGEITAIEQHPDADKLRVCQVAGHPDGIKQVVCGAPNAREGIKIPFATVGAVLPPLDDGKAFKIKKAKLRGVESFGMLCGQTELLVGDNDDGLFELPLDANVGQDFREYLQLDDTVIEVDLTPNRSDCLSIQGIAREVGVLYKQPVNPLTIEPVKAQTDSLVKARVDAAPACPVYITRVLENVDNTVQTPLWLQEKLRRSGIRSIDAVVDVTNFVLLEMGQPMHAFDKATLEGDMIVRFAQNKETLSLLNDQEITLDDSSLVVCDHQGLVALAGIMGGSRTAVSQNTTSLVLEAAFFDPIIIAGKARGYGLHTDSSHRFERGVDYTLAERAIERASALLIDITGANAGPINIVQDAAALPKTVAITLNKKRIAVGLGFAIDDQEIEDILTRLGLTLQSKTDTDWVFDVPSYRFDISIEADLLEELARIYGYNNLPTTTPVLEQTLAQSPESVTSLDTLKDHLASSGFNEAITYSFIDPALHKKLFDDQSAVNVLNPISKDMSIMRTSLLPGLVQTLIKNVNKQAQRVALFETGLTFKPLADFNADTMQGLAQDGYVAGLLYGHKADQSWHSGSQNVDFYDLKGALESLLSLAQADVTYTPCHDVAYLHPGQSAYVSLNGSVIGVLGALHPQTVKALGLNQSVFVFELQLDAVLSTQKPAFSPISKFPEVSRDIAIVVKVGVMAADIQRAITTCAGETLKHVNVFDVYSGKGIEEDEKSIAFSLIFQHPSRTLTEEEINTPMDAIITLLESEFNAKLR